MCVWFGVIRRERPFSQRIHRAKETTVFGIQAGKPQTVVGAGAEGHQKKREGSRQNKAATQDQRGETRGGPRIGLSPASKASRVPPFRLLHPSYTRTITGHEGIRPRSGSSITTRGGGIGGGQQRTRVQREPANAGDRTKGGAHWMRPLTGAAILRHWIGPSCRC